MTGVQNSILIQNVLANNTEDQACPDEEDGRGGCPTGGMANAKCAIWNISYEVNWIGMSVRCSTGGAYKCNDGKCPHGN